MSAANATTFGRLSMLRSRVVRLSRVPTIYPSDTSDKLHRLRIRERRTEGIFDEGCAVTEKVSPCVSGEHSQRLRSTPADTLPAHGQITTTKTPYTSTSHCFPSCCDDTSTAERWTKQRWTLGHSHSGGRRLHRQNAREREFSRLGRCAVAHRLFGSCLAACADSRRPGRIVLGR